MPKETKKQKNLDNLQVRPPVVVVLGHVDHGKSSLLEAIRDDFVITSKESGGITQHVAAYEVEHEGREITFIDTPGHEAFSAIRSRGAVLADIAILVVAADEGVKTQTKEAIKHIKESATQMIVAINKIDKPAADPERVKRELQREDISVESMGGQTPCVNISAKTKEGIEELLEVIFLVAEMENLTTDPSKPAEGVIIETRLNPSRGPTATLLITDGVLKKGDIVGAASAIGKIKALENFQGKSIETAGASIPATTLGFETLPKIGDRFTVFPNIEAAKNIGNKAVEMPAESAPESAAQTENGKQILNLIIKADMAGSLEAIIGILQNIAHEKVNLRILKAEAGPINESDVKLAQNSKARIVGFRVKTEPVALSLCQRNEVRIKAFDIIYELEQYVKEMMEKAVKAELVRTDLAKLKVLVVFLTDKKRQIVGGKILEGEVKKNIRLEISRNEEVLGRSKMLGLQKNKKAIETAKKNEEIGILCEGDIKIQEDDIITFFVEEFKK